MFLAFFSAVARRVVADQRVTPRTTLQADVAVDAIARLVLNLKDGQPVPAEDAQLVADCVAGGFWDVPGMAEEVQRSVAERELRATAYAL